MFLREIIVCIFRGGERWMNTLRSGYDEKFNEVKEQT